MTGKARLIERNGVLGPTIERPIPQPGAGELLLKIHATSLNFHDLVGIDGGIRGLPVPRVPCSDASATVLAVGDGNKRFAVGDAVTFLVFFAGAARTGVISSDLWHLSLKGLRSLSCVSSRRSRSGAVVNEPPISASVSAAA